MEYYCRPQVSGLVKFRSGGKEEVVLSLGNIESLTYIILEN